MTWSALASSTPYSRKPMVPEGGRAGASTRNCASREVTGFVVCMAAVRSVAAAETTAHRSTTTAAARVNEERTMTECTDTECTI